MFVAAVTVGSALVSPAADIKPADTSKPLFRIFAPSKIEPGAKRSLATVDDEHPLLVVWSVSDLILARDGKGVLITLHPKDAKVFAAATQKYNHGILFFEGDGRILEGMHITAPITDGIIGFKHPDEADVAEYLRRRFRIGELK